VLVSSSDRGNQLASMTGDDPLFAVLLHRTSTMHARSTDCVLCSHSTAAASLLNTLYSWPLQRIQRWAWQVNGSLRCSDVHKALVQHELELLPLKES
jgi:hypothetical protein